MSINARTKSQAFTLIEVMISIAIVVVLMLGITKVFSLTANTAGATNQIATGIRDARSAQTMFYNDLNCAASDMPFMILRCGTQPAFRNKADKLGDPDGNPLTIDLNGDNVEGDARGETITPATVNNRNHRVDVFSYFARGLFPRQTGNYPSTYLADMTTQEAWIWYGHLRLLNNAGTTYFDPGDTTTAGNDNNQYASDWALGREAILLKSPTGGVITDRQGVSQSYFSQGGLNFGCISSGTISTGAFAINGNVAPFGYQSIATTTPDGNPATTRMQSSRYDLAGATIASMSQQVSDYLTWLANPLNDPSHLSVWWHQLMSGDQMSAGPPTVSARFQAKTYVPQPMQGTDLALTSPLFVQHCSQFIVEYAGDFLNQDSNPLSATYGRVLNVYTNANGTDGLIDFVVDPTTKSRSVRWYGLPRDVDGDGTINGGADGSAVFDLPKSSDVIPLRDLWMNSITKGALPYRAQAPFERNFLSSSASLAVKSNYAAAGSAGMQTGDYYECVWGPSDPKPKMIRITMTIDDPSGKLSDGQTFQYVIQLH